MDCVEADKCVKGLFFDICSHHNPEHQSFTFQAMMRRGSIVRMDEWDKEPVERNRKRPKCDFTDALRIHVRNEYLYYSLFRRTQDGMTLEAIKNSEQHARIMADRACSLIDRLLLSLDGWCIVTTPRRRHFEGFNLSEFVSGLMSETKHIPFYKGAVQCITKDRLNPEFHLLRPIQEKKVIIFDDIITTGKTLTATRDLFLDKEQIVCIVAIHNN